MSGKKKSRSKGKNNAAPKKNNTNMIWIIGGVAVVVLLGVIAAMSGTPDGNQTTAPSPDEEAYVGRLLPADYEAPSVADRTLYTDPVAMTAIDGVPTEEGISIPLGAVVDSRIVVFEYARSDAEILPMIAYVKPSGALFVGVSYCPPCEGEGQRIESDGTLTCESCGTKRNLESNLGISGACKLYPLDEVPVAIEGDNILVDGTVLEEWTAQPLDRPIG